MADEQVEAAIGSVAEETARLLRVLGSTSADVHPDRPGRHPGQTGSAHVEDASPAVGASTSEHPGTCTWCPLCRGVHLVKNLSPETLRSLADVATLAASTFADLAARHTATAGTAGRDAGTRPSTPHGRRAARAVQDIVVTDGGRSAGRESS